MPAFLTDVKSELDAAYAAAFDALAEVTTDGDKLAETLTELKKGVWKVVEARLKESFTNGKKAAGAKPGNPETARKPNPFRKE